MVAMTDQSLAARFPGGCFLGFSGPIDQGHIERLIDRVKDAYLGGFTEITICLSSLGGSPDLGFYAYEMLRAMPIRIVMHAVGNVSSAANVLFLAADERLAAPYAVFYFHLTTRVSGANLIATQAGGVLGSLAADDTRARQLVAERTGTPEATAWGWFSNERTMAAAEALEVGIVHRIARVEIPADALLYQLIV
jgi:ATP-dependent protease ClpP protease subunit